MSEINIPYFVNISNTVVYNFWNNDFKVIRDGEFASLFIKQSTAENVDTNDTLIVFDCCNEGISPADIKLATDSLARAGIIIDIRVLFNIHVTESLPYRYSCFPGHFVAHCNFVSHVSRLNINWSSLHTDRYFIALMRRASVGRATFARHLLDAFDADTFLLSCGSQPNEWSEVPTDLKKAISPYTLPVLLDGFTDDYRDQHFHIDTNFFSCFFNVVVETSSQTDADSWRDVFITEKSLKPFAYRQIPIWFAVPGTVQAVRELGFDVYDDVINHEYDNEQNPTLRMEKVVTVLQDFINIYDLDGMKEWRRGLQVRINKNVELLFTLSKQHASTRHNIITELIK